MLARLLDQVIWNIMDDCDLFGSKVALSLQLLIIVWVLYWVDIKVVVLRIVGSIKASVSSIVFWAGRLTLI